MKSNVVELLRGRLATRAIDAAPLDDGVVDALIEAARLAPSCFNNQPWRFLFCVGDDARAKANECLSGGNKPWAGRAPLLVLAHAAPTDDCQLPDGREYYQFDVGLAVMNIMLAATEMGLVARPMAGFSPAKATELFGLPETAQPIVMIAIGKPSDDESHLPDHAKGKADAPRERKAAAEIATIL